MDIWFIDVYRYNLMDLRHGYDSYYSLNAGLNGYKLFGLVLFGTMVFSPKQRILCQGFLEIFFQHTNVQKQKVCTEAISVDEPRSLAKLKSASALSVGIRVPGQGQLLFSSSLADSKCVGFFFAYRKFVESAR